MERKYKARPRKEKPWSNADLRLLLKLAGTMPYTEIMKRLGVSENRLRGKALAQGISLRFKQPPNNPPEDMSE